MFRANTQRKAYKLGITGWVRNLPDGRVEVTARGNTLALAKFQAWLAEGPEGAHVDSVISAAIPNESFDDFSIR